MGARRYHLPSCKNEAATPKDGRFVVGVIRPGGVR